MDISIVILGITVSAALILVAVLIIKFIRKKEENSRENTQCSAVPPMEHSNIPPAAGYRGESNLPSNYAGGNTSFGGGNELSGGNFYSRKKEKEVVASGFASGGESNRWGDKDSAGNARPRRESPLYDRGDTALGNTMNPWKADSAGHYPFLEEEREPVDYYSPHADASPAPYAAASPASYADASPAPYADTFPAPYADTFPAPYADASPAPYADASPAPYAAASPAPYADASPAPEEFFKKESGKWKVDVKKEDKKPRFCGFCGNRIIAGNRWCPACGNPLPGTESLPKISAVNFSALTPAGFVPGEYGIINIAMYMEAYKSVVDQIIREYDRKVKETVSEKIYVENRSLIKIVLYSPDLEIMDHTETRIWKGDYLRFSFLVPVPEDYGKRNIAFIATVYIDNVIATKLKMTAMCSRYGTRELSVERRDILSAFISYAHRDRHDVMLILQGIQKARPDMKIFLDVESLRSGTNWEQAVKKEIDRRDILYLCWSQNARHSPEVDKEWRYALKRKGIDGIEPIPLEPPELCPPPVELSEKHFNDKYLYFNRNRE